MLKISKAHKYKLVGILVRKQISSVKLWLKVLVEYHQTRVMIC